MHAAHRGLGMIVFCGALLACSLVGRADEAPGLRDGWVVSREIPQEGGLGASRVKVSSEKGWLVVRRTDGDGELDWQIVLARASDPVEPVIAVKPTIAGNPGLRSLEVTYSGYYIRESSSYGGRLRVFRERKTEAMPEWPTFEPRERSQRWPRGSIGDSFQYWPLDYWCWVECGAVRNRPDVWLRLRPTTERPIDLSRSNNQWRLGVAAGGPFELQFGDSEAQDEGDLLIAVRATSDIASRGLSGRGLVSWLKAKDKSDEAPALTARAWLNAAEKPLLLQDQLRGKVVLVHFFSSEIPSSMKRLPRLEELHRKYAERGLAVVGIHAADKASQAEDLKRIVREAGVTFPVMVDRGEEKPGDRLVAGETAARYLVDVLPCCFLINRAGKIVQGYAMAPPGDSSIEPLLGQ